MRRAGGRSEAEERLVDAVAIVIRHVDGETREGELAEIVRTDS
jgi:hypothetical protein